MYNLFDVIFSPILSTNYHLSFIFVHLWVYFFGPKQGKIISLSKQTTNFFFGIILFVLLLLSYISLYIPWQFLLYYVYIIIISDNVRRQSVFGSSQLQCGRYIKYRWTSTHNQYSKKKVLMKRNGCDSRSSCMSSSLSIYLSFFSRIQYCY